MPVPLILVVIGRQAAKVVLMAGATYLTKKLLEGTNIVGHPLSGKTTLSNALATAGVPTLEESDITMQCPIEAADPNHPLHGQWLKDRRSRDHLLEVARNEGYVTFSGSSKVRDPSREYVLWPTKEDFVTRVANCKDADKARDAIEQREQLVRSGINLARKAIVPVIINAAQEALFSGEEQG
jgi:hypothetical protein